MIRRLPHAVACLVDTRYAALADELEEAHEEVARLIGRVADLAGENQSLRMILAARRVEVDKLRKDFSDLICNGEVSK